MRRALLSAICLLTLAVRVVADDVYISNLSGDDRFDGRSTQKSSDFGGPVRTFAKARSKSIGLAFVEQQRADLRRMTETDRQHPRCHGIEAARVAGFQRAKNGSRFLQRGVGSNALRLV